MIKVIPAPNLLYLLNDIEISVLYFIKFGYSFFILLNSLGDNIFKTLFILLCNERILFNKILSPGASSPAVEILVAQDTVSVCN